MKHGGLPHRGQPGGEHVMQPLQDLGLGHTGASGAHPFTKFRQGLVGHLDVVVMDCLFFCWIFYIIFFYF
jgi:hypothetical protein